MPLRVHLMINRASAGSRAGSARRGEFREAGLQDFLLPSGSSVEQPLLVRLNLGDAFPQLAKICQE